MSFSFNPGQTAEAGTPMSGGVSVPGAAEVQNTALAVPDSPFLFMQQRGQEMSTGAYVQIVLIMLSILSVAVSVVLFAYSMYLTASIDNKKETLLTKDAPFKDYPLEDMKRLSLRFNVLGGILQNYVSIRTPLKMLEDVVEKQVVFEKFSVTKSTAFGQGEAYVMNFSVVTTNYKALVQQLEALNLTQYSKVAPKSKVGNVVETGLDIKVDVTAPLYAKGVLPEDVNFVATETSTAPSVTAQVSASTSVGTTTP